MTKPIDNFEFDEFDFSGLDFSDFNAEQIKSTDEKVKEAQNRKGNSILKSEKILIKYKRQHYKIVKNMGGSLDFPERGLQFRIITQKSFNAFSIILRVLETEEIEEMYLATYNIKETIISALFDLLVAKKIKSLNLMLSESIKFRMPKRIEQLRELFDKHKDDYSVRIKLNWNHAKIILIKTKTEFYCVEGSGNLSDNARIEQYVLDNNKDLYEFHRGWMNSSYGCDELKREETFK